MINKLRVKISLDAFDWAARMDLVMKVNKAMGGYWKITGWTWTGSELVMPKLERVG